MADTQYNIDLVLNAKNQASQELEKVSWQVNSIGATIWKLWISAWIISWMKSFASSTLELWWNLEQASIAFETMLWSGEEADKMLKDLSDFAKKTPFELTGVRDSAKQLMAYWFSAEEVIPTLKALWDVASWLSVPIGQLALPMGQVRVAGKLLTNDLKQFQNAWVDLVWELSKNLWKSKAEIQEMVSKWMISADMVAEAFETMTSAWWKFEDLMSKQSWTYQWMMSNLQDSFDWIKESLWMAILPLLEKLLWFINPLVERVSERVQEHQKLATVIAWVVGAWLWLVAVLWSMSIIAPIVWWAISLLTWPIWIVIWAITLLATARATNFGWIQEKTQQVIDFIKPYVEWLRISLQEFRDNYWTYIMTAIYAARDLIKAIVADIVDVVSLAFEWLFTALWVLIDIFSWNWESAWTKIKNFGQTIAKTIDDIMTRTFGDMRTNIKNWVTEAYNRIVWKIQALVDKVREIIQDLKNAWNSAKEAVGWIFSRDRDTRASGWPVYQWQQYLVWENWPEMFVPSTNWRIIRNEDLWWSWEWIVVNINMWWVAVSNWQDEQSLAETIANTITRQLELYKKAIY